MMAPDPAVPRRDALLRPETMAGVLSRRLLGGVPVDRCERIHAKYRFGLSLRVAYRLEAAGGVAHVAARTFASSEPEYRKALAGAAETARPGAAGGGRPAVPAVAHAPEVGAVLWTFPHDRRLTALPILAGGPELDALVGRPCARTELVAYAPERSATAACLDERGRPFAYAKVGAAEAERRGIAHVSGVRVPRVLGAADGVLGLEALAGERLDVFAGGLPALGAALARMHALPAPEPRYERTDQTRLATAAAIVARARPDAAAAAERLLGRLIVREDDARGEPVCLHGDPNLRNALRMDDGQVALLDLEHLSHGPAAADLGHVRAGLLGAGRRGRELLDGYATVAAPPDPAALRWHTAASLLARCALPAVSRVRPHVLERMRELLDVAAGLLPVRMEARA